MSFLLGVVVHYPGLLKSAEDDTSTGRLVWGPEHVPRVDYEVLPVEGGLLLLPTGFCPTGTGSGSLGRRVGTDLLEEVGFLNEDLSHVGTGFLRDSL